jgi:hypothetical protein
MEAIGRILCSAIPAFEEIVPVGDLVGGGNTHYQSNLDLFVYGVGFGGALPLNATLRDRVATPGSVHVVSAAPNGAVINEPFHSDSISDLLGVPPPFFGTLAIAFLFTQQFTLNWENNAAISRRFPRRRPRAPGRDGIDLEGRRLPWNRTAISRPVSCHPEPPAQYRHRVGTDRIVRSVGAREGGNDPGPAANPGSIVTVPMPGNRRS